MEKFAQGFKKVQKVFSVLIGAALFLMIAIVFLQTVCRAFKISLTWSEEVSRYLFVALIALGINLASTKHLFVRIEIIDGYLKGGAMFVMDVVRKLAAMYVSFVFVYSGYELIKIGGYQVSPAVSIPMSALYGIIFLGFILNAVALVVDAWETFSGAAEVVVVEPHKYEVREVPIPEPKDDQVQIKMMAAGVCGSDIHIFKGENPNSRYPLIPGHENVGIVTKVGKDCTRIQAGDHVVIDYVMRCGECYQCTHNRGNVCEHVLVRGSGADGGWRQFWCVEESYVYKIDDSIPWAGAALIEPLTIGEHSTSRGRVCADDVVFIMGAGAIGTIIAQACKLKGAKTVICCDISDSSLERSKLFGADYTMVSWFGGQTVPAYTAAKGGVTQLTKELSNDWIARGVNVNAIAPGYMATEMNAALLDPANPRYQQITDRIPANRWGTGDDMKGACIFLASHASDYLGIVGAGTVTTKAHIDATIAAGGQFIVTPGFDPELVAYAQEKNIPIYPGCTTPTDYHAALKFGLELIKFFPAEQSGGLAKIKAMSAPFPQFKVMPTGGISLKNLKEYLSAPVIAACGGSYMVTADLIENQKWDEITGLCRKSVEIVKEARQ